MSPMRIAVVLLLLFSIPVSAQIPFNHLIAYYPFCGNANDMSGHGHHLQNNATSTTNRFQFPSAAYDYNGSTSMSHNDTVFNFSGDFTYSCWFLPDTSQNATFLYNGHSGQNGYGLIISGAPVFSIGSNLTVLYGGINHMITTPVALHQWHHAVFRKTGTTAQLYLDTVLIGTCTSTFNAPVGKFQIGKNYQDNLHSFLGKVDDVAVYDTSLTFAQIRQLFLDQCSITASITPVSQPAQTNGSVSFSATTTANVFSYQWQQNIGSGFVNLSNTATYSGVNTATLTISNPPLVLSGSTYRCVIVDISCCADTAGTGTLGVIPFLCPSITNLPDTIDACTGATIPLSPGLSSSLGTFMDTTWTPSNGLSNPNIINPVVTVGTTSQKYRLDVVSVSNTNLVVNGNFSSGNTGFTSSYSLGTGGPWGPCSNAATYGVTTSPFLVHSLWANYGDHTTGTGQMLCVNGSTVANVDIWCQTVTVNPNTDYDFSTWISTVSNASPGILQFRINGALLAAPFNAPVAVGPWVQFHTTWNSGSSNTATICISNQNTVAVGNDFALDDIAFKEACISTDSVYIRVLPNVAATATSNSPLCTGDTLKLFAPTVSGMTYAWTGPGSFSSSTQNPFIPNATTANGGVYSLTLSNSIPGCSFTGTTNVVVNPKPLISGMSFVNPSTCGGTNGTITLTGLSPNTIYTISYTVNSTPVTLVSQTSTAGGSYTITGLGVGTYSNITVTLNGCTSLPAGPITLSSPPASATPVVGSNSPVCAGNTLNLTASTISGATYSWTGPNTFSSSQQNPSISNTTSANAGSYSVTATVNGCTSPAATVNVVIIPTPVISSVTFTNPTTCGGTDGTITITGLNNNTSYIISYLKNLTLTQVTLTSNGSGSITLTGLGIGTYFSIAVMLNGCTSTAVGPIVLSNPSAPAAPTVSNNGPICAGATLNLTASTTAGGTYVWTGPGTYTSSQQNPSINNAQASNAGTYSVIVTANGCSSVPATTTVVVNPLPSTPVINTNSPVCTGSTLSLGATSTTGSSYSWTGPNSFTAATQNTSVTNATSAAAGTYTVTATLNGCTSVVATATVVINPTPVIVSVTSTNPTACGVADGSITITGLNNNTSYTINYSKNTISQAPVILSSSASGAITITGLGVGTFSGITVTINGCTSAPAGPVTLSNPSTPVAPVVGNNGPICAGGILNLTASTTAGGTYAWTGPGTFTSAQQNPSISNAQASNAGTYSVTVTVNGCTSIPATTTVVINPLPSTPAINTNSPVCAGSTLTLDATSTAGSSYAWTGPNSFSAGTQNTSVTNTTSAAAGTYSVTATLAGCTSATATAIVVVTPIPVIGSVSFTNPTTCGGTDGTITINGLSNNLSYTVSYLKGLTFIQVTLSSNSSGSIALTGLGIGTYSNITVTLNGCTSAAVGPIVLSNPAAPSTPIVGNNGPICAGAMLNLTASTTAGGTYAWTGPGTYSSTQQNPSITGAQTSNAGTYSVTVTVYGCTSLPATTTVIINPTPSTPVITSNSPVCAGSTVSLGATSLAGSSYTWTGPNSFNAGTQNTTITNATAAAGGVYTVTASLNGCTSQPATTTVVINQIPPAPGVSNVTYCQNATAGPLTATGQNLLWYTVPNGGSPVPTPIVTTTIPNSFTVYVSQTVNCCESPRSAITVTVTAQAPPPVVISPVNYCEGATTVPLTATGQGLRWYTQATGGTGSATAPTPSSAMVATTTWYVTQSINGVCESQRVPIIVIVNPIPAAPVVISPLRYCQDDNAQALTAQGQNLVWYQQSAGGSGNSVAPLPNTAVPGTTSYYVSQTVNGCESDRSKIDVVVDEKIIAQISSNNSSVCQFDSIVISNDATNPASAIYAWSFGNANVLSGNGSGPYLLKWNAEGTKTITLTVTNGVCRASDTMVLILQPSPMADFELGGDICVEEMITLQAAWNSLSGSTYHWDFGDANVISGSGAGFYRMNWHTAGLKVVSLFVSNINGCHSDLIIDTITVHDLPNAEILNSSTSVCIGDTVHFEARDLGNGYSYVWKPAEFFPINGVNATQGIIKKAGLINLAVTDKYGCAGTDSVFVSAKPCCDIMLPDAFTPNGDGRNDRFKPIQNGHYKVSNFRVMNRWGQTVFETANPGEGWDGTFNGALQELGTYFYYVKYICGNDETFEKKGDVTLVR